MKKTLIAIAVLMCSYSLPAMASGNYACQLDGLIFSNLGHGITAAQACLDAVKPIASEVAAYATANNSGTCTSGHPILTQPRPLKEDASYVCAAACAAGDTVPFSNNNGNSFCLPGISVTSNVQASTGTSWGPQNGSTHTYDSVSAGSSSPDVIAYYGPEDGNISIEIDAEHGFNSTAVSAVSLTNATWGNSVGTVTHTQTNPDIWRVSGSAVPYQQYNLDVTFSHTGGYGEYSVKMQAPNTLKKSWVPTAFFGTTQASVTASNCTYQAVGNRVDITACSVIINNKNGGTGRLSVALPITENGTGPICGDGITSSIVSFVVNPYQSSAEFLNSDGHWIDDTDLGVGSYVAFSACYSR